MLRKHLDLKITKNYDTFNLSSGISNLQNENVLISYEKNKYKINKK